MKEGAKTRTTQTFAQNSGNDNKHKNNINGKEHGNRLKTRMKRIAAEKKKKKTKQKPPNVRQKKNSTRQEIFVHFSTMFRLYNGHAQLIECKRKNEGRRSLKTTIQKTTAIRRPSTPLHKCNVQMATKKEEEDNSNRFHTISHFRRLVFTSAFGQQINNCIRM